MPINGKLHLHTLPPSSNLLHQQYYFYQARAIWLQGGKGLNALKLFHHLHNFLKGNGPLGYAIVLMTLLTVSIYPAATLQTLNLSLEINTFHLQCLLVISLADFNHTSVAFFLKVCSPVSVHASHLDG
jgi:hypothetical protein